MLPRTLTIESDGWHRLSPEDISDISQLQLFLNSLEFCNAVVQVSYILYFKTSFTLCTVPGVPYIPFPFKRIYFIYVSYIDV